MNYFYLSDGTKLSALDGSGEGLVYRGPFVYRKSSGSNAGSSLTLESAAGIGVLAIISGNTSIGIGISMMTVGLISDPSSKTQEMKDKLPTDLKSILAKSADIILENENNEIENTVSIIFFAKDLFLFKPNSMENVVDYIKAGGDWADRFLFFWDLYDQHDKQEQAEKEEFNENQSKE